MRRILSILLACTCLVPHIALAQQLGYGVPFGLSANNLSNTATGSGYAANDTITLACTTNPSNFGYVPFTTSPVIKVLTVSSGAIATYVVQTAGATNGPFSIVNVSCTQASTSGSGTGATFNGQLSLAPPVTPVMFDSGTSLPVASSCGTSPSVTTGSNSNAGQFTMGTATPTACTITFASPFPNYGFCTVTPASSGGAAITGGYYLSAQSKTAFTLTIGTGTSSLVWNYTCFGA